MTAFDASTQPQLRLTTGERRALGAWFQEEGSRPPGEGESEETKLRYLQAHLALDDLAKLSAYVNVENSFSGINGAESTDDWRSGFRDGFLCGQDPDRSLEL